jgi:hypothetical protein
MPIVAMKSGIRPLVMMMPLVAPAAYHQEGDQSRPKADRADGRPGYVELLGHQHSGKRCPKCSHGSNRQVNPAGNDHQCLANRQDGGDRVCLETLTMLLRSRKCGVAVDR